MLHSNSHLHPPTQTGSAHFAAARHAAAVASAGTPHVQRVYAPPPPVITVPATDPRMGAGPGIRVSAHSDFHIDPADIMGYSGVEDEDRKDVMDLMIRVVTMYCPDKRYDDPSYQRPMWCRIEPGTGTSGYTILFGGWSSLELGHVQAIWTSDPQVGLGRTIRQITILMATPNDNPDAHELTLVLQYASSSSRRREIARARGATTDAPPPLVGAAVDDFAVAAGANSDNPRKRPFLGNLVNFLLGADDQ